MAASQNGFGSYKLSIPKKTNIMQSMTKIFKFFYLIFYHREIVKSFYDTFLELCTHLFVTQPLQNPFCSSTKKIKAYKRLSLYRQ